MCINDAVLQYISENPKLHLKKGTVYGWLKKKDKYLKINKSNTLEKYFTMKTSKKSKAILTLNKVYANSALSKEEEDKLDMAIVELNERGVPVNFKLIRRMALYIYNNSTKRNNKVPFVASNSFVSRFKRRKSLSLRKATKQKTPPNLCGVRKSIVDFFDNNSASLKKLDARMLANCDETPTRFVPSTNYTICRTGTKVVNLPQSKDHRKQVTSLLTITAAGGILPPYIVFPGLSTNTKIDLLNNTGNSVLARSKSGWINELLMVDYLSRVVKPYAQKIRKSAKLKLNYPFTLVLDNFKAHFTSVVLKFAKDNHITLLALPKNATPILQPLDVAFNRDFKRKIDDAMQEFFLQQLDSVDTMDELVGMQAGRQFMLDWVNAAISSMEAATAKSAFDLTIFDRKRTLDRFDIKYPTIQFKKLKSITSKMVKPCNDKVKLAKSCNNKVELAACLHSHQMELPDMPTFEYSAPNNCNLLSDDIFDLDLFNISNDFIINITNDDAVFNNSYDEVINVSNATKSYDDDDDDDDDVIMITAPTHPTPELIKEHQFIVKEVIRTTILTVCVPMFKGLPEYIQMSKWSNNSCPVDSIIPTLLLLQNKLQTKSPIMNTIAHLYMNGKLRQLKKYVYNVLQAASPAKFFQRFTPGKLFSVSTAFKPFVEESADIFTTKCKAVIDCNCEENVITLQSFTETQIYIENSNTLQNLVAPYFNSNDTRHLLQRKKCRCGANALKVKYTTPQCLVICLNR